jgi:hypothetical protein
MRDLINNQSGRNIKYLKARGIADSYRIVVYSGRS